VDRSQPDQPEATDFDDFLLSLKLIESAVNIRKGLDHRSGHARVFFPCRKNSLS